MEAVKKYRILTVGSVILGISDYCSNFRIISVLAELAVLP